MTTSHLRGLLLGAALLLAGLLGAVVFLLLERRGAGAVGLGDPAVRAAAVNRLVELGTGFSDSFPDPDVGRVMQPNLRNFEAFDTKISTNALGWRERAVVVPKPPATTRVVLLGDSFVFGPGVAAEDLMEVSLQRFLSERARGEARAVEVVHVGMSSWNIQAEASYLRRALGVLAPDLVVHVVVGNDLGDSGAARGFGAVADFSSQHPERTTMIYDFYPIWGLNLGFTHASPFLNAGLGYESRHRYADAAERLVAFERALAAAGAEYLLLSAWEGSTQIAAQRLTQSLPANKVLFVPTSFRGDLRYRISDSDPHWSPGGHQEVAKLVFGAIQENKLLPRLRLADWPEAAAIFRRLQAHGQAEALAPPPDPTSWSAQVSTAIDFRQLSEERALQIYGGLGPEGFVSPYAAVLLRRDDARSLRLTGSALPDSELRGAMVRVFADEFELGTLTLAPSAMVDQTFELPIAVRQRPFFDVRFTADNWVYRGADLRRCVVFRLDRLEALP